ncbi:hypothetical protein ACFQ51_20660 [Streptomyces kaempferi]
MAMASVITVQPASAHGATAFLSQVADAASKQKTPSVGAHQFIYVKSKVGFTHQIKQRTIGGPAKLDAVHQREVWLAADPSKDGLIHEGGENITIHNSGAAWSTPTKRPSPRGRAPSPRSPRCPRTPTRC